MQALSPLLLPADPTLPLHAATKQYVDAHAGGGGGGTLLHTDAVIVNFGAAPGTNNVSLVVEGQTGILTTSVVRAYMMCDATADHNADEHIMVPMKLCCGNIIADTSFTLYAASEWQLTGTFVVHFIWSN